VYLALNGLKETSGSIKPWRVTPGQWLDVDKDGAWKAGHELIMLYCNGIHGSNAGRSTEMF